MHVEDAIQQFYNRKQKSDENHYLYMLELISLAEKAFPDLNHNQIKKIVGRQLINGLANAFIKSRMRYECNTFTDTETILNAISKLEESSFELNENGSITITNNYDLNESRFQTIPANNTSSKFKKYNETK